MSPESPIDVSAYRPKGQQPQEADSVMSAPIENNQFKFAYFDDPSEDVDPAFVGMARTASATLRMHEAIQAAARTDAVDPEDFPFELSQEYVDDLEAVISCFKELVEREDYEAVKRDVSTLDDEMLAEVRATIGYVAPHFGVDLKLPVPDGST